MEGEGSRFFRNANANAANNNNNNNNNNNKQPHWAQHNTWASTDVKVRKI
jgi:hypothetical protein